MQTIVMNSAGMSAIRKPNLSILLRFSMMGEAFWCPFLNSHTVPAQSVKHASVWFVQAK